MEMGMRAKQGTDGRISHPKHARDTGNIQAIIMQWETVRVIGV